MTDRIYQGEAVSLAQDAWNWEGAVFYTNLVVGDVSVQFNRAHTTYDQVLATPGLSEYTHASYVADKTLFALNVNSLGQVVPVSPPGVITWAALAANTAQSGANIRAAVTCRRIGGSPAGTDPPVCWHEDYLVVDPVTHALIQLNGEGTDFSISWPSTFLTSSSVYERWYNTGFEGVLNGTGNLQTLAAAGRLYFKLIVGAPTVPHNPAHQTITDVLTATGIYAGLSEYVGSGYVSNTVIPPLSVAAGTTVAALMEPSTLPWVQQYTNLWPNTAQSNAFVRCILLCRRLGATATNGDPVICWIERSVSVDPTDGTPLKFAGGRVNAGIAWPSTFAGITTD